MTLPSEYQEVEYIQSTGNQYIDTGYNYNGTYFRIDFQLMFNSYSYGGTGANVPFICGVIGRSYGNMFMSVGANDRVFGIATGTEMATSLPVQLGTKYDTMLEYKSGTMTFKSNGSTVTTSSTGTFYTGKSIPLFCRWDYNGSLYSYFCTDMRMYGCKIYSAENVLARDFVPCYRKSDDEIGLYDLINDTFYTNQGTGTFTKGPNVVPVPTYKLHGAIQTFHYQFEVPYSREPGEDTLLYLPLESDAIDYSGNSRSTTPSNITYATLGGVMCANANGSSSKISIGDTGVTSSLTAGTISILTYNKSWTYSSTYTKLLECTKNNCYFIVNSDTSRNLILGGPQGYTNWTYTSVTNGLNNWYHILATFDSSGMRLFSNGELIVTATYDGSNGIWGKYTASYEIGNYVFCNRGGNNNRWNGGARELILEKRKWSDEEVVNYYNWIKNKLGF